MERARAARLLGVDIMATPEQVRDAFRRRAREAHPDRAGGDTAAMAELNAAYEALSVRAGDGWEFAGPLTHDQRAGWSTVDDEAPLDEPDDQQLGGWSLLRAFPIALVMVGAVVLTVMFVGAIGYDWSVSP